MADSQKNPKSTVDLIDVIVTLLVVVVLGAMITGYVMNKRHPTSSANACMNYLREIDVAKNEWALKNGKKDGDVCTEVDIRPYFSAAKGNFPRCLDGGVYTIGKIGENPTCSLGKTDPLHSLP